MARTADRAARRAGIVSAAAAVFARDGVANATVSDIVKEAGVAQGTFYLYFDTKDDALLAVVEQTGDAILDGIERRVDAKGATAVEKLFGLRDALAAFDQDETTLELAAVLHRPENRALHDRLEQDLMPRLLPLMESIVAQGVAEGAFDVTDTRAAAVFVLGGLHGAEMAGTPVRDMPRAIATMTGLALRALGHGEPR